LQQQNETKDTPTPKKKGRPKKKKMLTNLGDCMIADDDRFAPMATEIALAMKGMELTI